MAASRTRITLLAAVQLGALILAHNFGAVAAVVSTEFDGGAVSAGIRTAAQTRVDFLLDVLAFALTAYQHNWRIADLGVRIHQRFKTRISRKARAYLSCHSKCQLST